MGKTFEWWDVAGTPAWPELQPYRSSENRQPHGIDMLIRIDLIIVSEVQ